MQYADVVFLQGDDADTAFDYASAQGNGNIDESILLDYLSQWDYGDIGEGRDTPPHGTSDDTYETDEYILSYNWSYGTCGLVRKLRLAMQYLRSTYGHTFVDSTELDSGGFIETCLICGAEYELIEEADGYGVYTNSAGSDPGHCTGRTDLIHGIPSETPCQADNGRSCAEYDALTGRDDLCDHYAIKHGCNCVLCTS